MAQLDEDEAPLNSADYWSTSASIPRSGPGPSGSRGVMARRGGGGVGPLGRGSGWSASMPPASNSTHEAIGGDLNRAEAGRLAGADATPAEYLSPGLKLIKATQLLSNAFFRNGQPQEDAALTLETYSSVVNLLSSTLGDLASVPPISVERSAPTVTDVMSALLTGRRLPSPEPSVFRHVAFANPTEVEVGKIVEQNSILALSLLRPDMFPATPSASSSAPVDKADEPTGTTPAYIEALPLELLLAIFRYAREAADVRPKGTEIPSGMSRYDVPSATYACTGDGQVEGSRTAGQRWILRLALVCKAWAKPARAIAFRQIFVRRGPDLVTLNKLLETEVHLAAQIQGIDALVLPFGADSSGPRRPRGGVSSLGTSSSTNSDVEADGSERNAGAQFAALVKKATNLSKLHLSIKSGRSQSAGYLMPPSRQARDFLETSVYNALTSIPKLRDLTLAFTIDFEELEHIINSAPLLECLQLSNVENLTGNATVSSIGPHPATRLRRFKLGEPSTSYLPTSITPPQLAWLLEPAVASLKYIDIVLVTDGRGGGGAAPPFASAEFADLLVQATSLDHLGVQDIGLSGASAPSFAQAPHNGNFDYALSHLTRLQVLVVPGFYLGSHFLPSVTPHPLIRRIAFSGAPAHTSAADVADAIETSWPKLKTFRVVGQTPGAAGMAMFGQGGMPNSVTWSGAERRRIEQATSKRGIECAWK